MQELFFFDKAELADVADQHRDAYASARPFPHAVIDNFLAPAVIDELLAEFPKPDDKVDWQVLEHQRERKLALAADWRTPPYTRHLLAEFNASTFVSFLEDLTGIEGLIPDPHFVGGGLHQIEPGGFLKVHADFNKHKRLRLDRRLNVLVYLNRDWPVTYGGDLQLWNRDMTQCEKSVLPVAGRCVIFSTTDESYHGHPDPLSCPDGVTRKSLAFYYYSNGRPATEMSTSHTTLFRARPQDKDQPSGHFVRELASRLVPPIMLDGARAIRNRASRSRPGRTELTA